MKYIAVQGCQLDCIYAQIQTSPKTSMKCDGKATYAGDLIIKISGYSGGGITDGNGIGSGTLTGSAQHVKIDNERVVLEEDSCSIPVNGTSGGNPVPTVIVNVKISSAGQIYIKGE